MSLSLVAPLRFPSPLQAGRSHLNFVVWHAGAESLPLKGGGWRRRRRVGVTPLGRFGACVWRGPPTPAPPRPPPPPPPSRPPACPPPPPHALTAPPPRPPAHPTH